MRALTYHGNGDIRVDTVDDPKILRPTDAVVRVTLAAICGSDLHFFHAGDAFGFEPGQRIGHEFIGTVEEVGPECTAVKPGDRVLASCTILDGTCVYCQEGLASSCAQWSQYGLRKAAWKHGGEVEGAQSQYVRVPMADVSLVTMPDALSGPEYETAMLPLVDPMSTAMHGLASAGFRAGQNVVVIGDGPVGLSGVHIAAALEAENVICTGHHADRLVAATALGATDVIASRDNEEITERVKELTSGQGAHVIIDSISGTASMATAQATVRPGGAIAGLGMDHFMGHPPEVNWRDQFLRNITITGGYVPGPRYIPELLRLTEAGKINAAPLLTTRLPLEEGPEGYRLMAERADGVVKVALVP